MVARGIVALMHICGACTQAEAVASIKAAMGGAMTPALEHCMLRGACLGLRDTPWLLQHPCGGARGRLGQMASSQRTPALPNCLPACRGGMAPRGVGVRGTCWGGAGVSLGLDLCHHRHLHAGCRRQPARAARHPAQVGEQWHNVVSVGAEAWDAAH